MLDQRCARKIVIADINRNVCRMWARAAARDKTIEVAAEVERVQAQVTQEQVQLNLSDESAYKVGDNDKTKIDKDYIQMKISDNSSKRNLTKLPTLASVCDKYGVSNYAGAVIASTTLVDYTIIPKVYKSQVIEPQKLGYDRRRRREERREAELGNLKELTSLYFDKKKTMTRVLVKNNKTGRWSPTMKVDDHYVVYDFLVEHVLTSQPLYVAGCDGCRVNTGSNRDVILIHHLEMLLARSLHHSICQLRGNELPLRSIFYCHDDKPSGPENWQEIIGQQIKEPAPDLPAFHFQPITFSDYPVCPRKRYIIIV